MSTRQVAIPQQEDGPSQQKRRARLGDIIGVATNAED